VDCAGDFDNHGCDGGLPSHAFEYIREAGGLTTEDQYVYTAVDGNCTLPGKKQSVGIVGGSFNLSTVENDLLYAILNHGPVSIAYKVMPDFRPYISGVYTHANCPNGAMDVNHAVLAIGYGTENGMDYWLIKNSWGAAWGDNGFFKIQRGVNMCGIVNCNSYPMDVIDLNTPIEFLN
jgi:cathepsin H